MLLHSSTNTPCQQAQFLYPRKLVPSSSFQPKVFPRTKECHNSDRKRPKSSITISNYPREFVESSSSSKSTFPHTSKLAKNQIFTPVFIKLEVPITNTTVSESNQQSYNSRTTKIHHNRQLTKPKFPQLCKENP